jgi:hypothetical protein
MRLWRWEYSAIPTGAIFWPAPGSRRLAGIVRAGKHVPASTTGHPRALCILPGRTTNVPSTGSAPAGRVSPRPAATKGPGARSTGIRTRGIRTGAGDLLRQGDCPPLRLAPPAPRHREMTDLRGSVSPIWGEQGVRIVYGASRLQSTHVRRQAHVHRGEQGPRPPVLRGLPQPATIGYRGAHPRSC